MEKLEKELAFCKDKDFKIGEYLYMGMAKVKNKTVCISVGYKIDYAIKKAKEFSVLISGVNFYKVNKVKVGELAPMNSFIINKDDQ